MLTTVPKQSDHGGDLGDGQDRRQQEVEIGQDFQFDDVAIARRIAANPCLDVSRPAT